MYVLIAVIAAVSILGSVVGYLCVKHKTKFPKQPSPKAKTVELNALLPKQQQLRAREFPLANVRFMQELGEGAFGKNLYIVFNRSSYLDERCQDFLGTKVIKSSLSSQYLQFMVLEEEKNSVFFILFTCLFIYLFFYLFFFFLSLAEKMALIFLQPFMQNVSER